uniref:Katanin p80 WD40 repeat-containing subunit B1 homolog n=1 Tax=Leersia perrieri TaxID=77586 RepID=A0A0D9VQF7_9ORYZ
MDTKRAYKLQEFVAHASDVNCVKVGKRTSRILITGGEDKKVNVWAIGKPSAVLSLSGLTSPVDSVSFDSSEVMIGAGASSGTIKIWDVEEAKVIRTFTGHRSSCASLDFHPFGEFFASGSSDTNMKIWDMRKKGCIHTYKGHTRRIDVLRFTPDGRWIVSGGSDNSVKIWDLTAGKLLHDFKMHEGPINCLDFHPHEFLLATGSADKTVKFWDLETFELIGSSGPENSREYFEPASVVRSMTFNKDGKSLFCGLHESLKVLSWEPIICHDMVDIGWSTLGDLIVHEGKLVGCSYNQSCVGVWIVDLMKIEPYAVSNAEEYLNGSVKRSIQADNSISSVLGRLSVSSSPDNETSSSTLHKPSKMSASKEVPVPASSAMTQKLPKAPVTSNHQLTRSDSVPVLSPRVRLNPKFFDDQKRQIDYVVPVTAPRAHSKVDPRRSSLPSVAPTNRPRSKTSAFSSEGSSFIPVAATRHSPKRLRSSVAGEQRASAGDEDNIADLMENHQEFIHAVKSRLTKLEVIKSMAIYRICYFEMHRVTVSADIINVLMENTNSITLDICTSVLRLASSVLESSYDSHLKVALEMIIKLVKSFGAIISSTLSFTPVGVDIEAEQRFQRCNLCFQELVKVHSVLFTLTRRQGEVGRSAQELSLFLQDIFQQSSR